MNLDVYFDFTSDSPGYWDHFWENNGGHGGGNCDPDSASPTLRKHHQILWSRRLPNGEMMELSPGKNVYLGWKNMFFGSDSITASFRYGSYPLLKEIEQTPNYRQRVEDYMHRAYSIGGMMIFPGHRNSFNQMRGMNRKIRDRWDWSLECIRRYYAGETSPLTKQIETDAPFYELFVDFNGFVEFFYLEDCLTGENTVRMWTEGIPFERSAFPQSPEEYWKYIQYELEFVEKRNQRIYDAVVVQEVRK